VKASAHGVNQHICRLQMLRRLGMTFAPPLQSGKGVVFFLRAADFNQWMFRFTPS
jgi:hypothetical protein